MTTNRVFVDFRAARGHEETELVCTVISHYGGRGRKRPNSSDFIIEAYRHYDASEPSYVTGRRNFRTIARSFVTIFGIRSQEDIFDVIERKPVDMDTRLLEPYEKHFTVYEDDSSSMSLAAALNAVRFRDRGSVLTRIIFQYLAHGCDEYYNRLCAYRLLEWLKNETDEYRITEIADMVLEEAGDVIKDFMPVDAKQSSNDLRVLIGLEPVVEA